MAKWIFNEDADGDHAIFSETGKLVAVTVGWENSAASWSKEEDVSHARLIAAAPTMCEALKEVIDVLDDWAATEEFVSVNNALNLSKAAIKLAEDSNLPPAAPSD